jgi:hypothetical protein
MPGMASLGRSECRLTTTSTRLHQHVNAPRAAVYRALRGAAKRSLRPTSRKRICPTLLLKHTNRSGCPELLPTCLSKPLGEHGQGFWSWPMTTIRDLQGH